MRRFEFKFQRLEEVRKAGVVELRARVLGVRMQIAEVESRLERLRAGLEETRDQLLRARTTPGDYSLHMPYELYIDLLKQRRARSAEELAKRRKELTELRALLVEANRELKVVEKVHERKVREYLLESLSEEQKELDEQGILYN
jgi:flagellar FliJ protein